VPDRRQLRTPLPSRRLGHRLPILSSPLDGAARHRVRLLAPLCWGHAAQSNPLLRRGRPSFHHLQLLSPTALAGHHAPPRPVSHRARAGTQALCVRRRRIRGDARARSSADQRAPNQESFDRDAGSQTRLARRVLAQARRRRNPSQASLFEHAPQHIWQKRFYDFNVWSARKRAEKLRYMHRNPVERGLVASPELWRWSSFRAYFLGEPGPVRVNAWEILKLTIRPPVAEERRPKLPTARQAPSQKA